MTIVLFLTAFGLGFSLGTAAGAIVVGAIFKWAKGGTATTSSPSLTAADIEKQISRQYCETTIYKNPEQILRTNPELIKPKDGTSD